MRTLSSLEVKAIERDILKTFISVCEKEGYYYSLAYGTLIGAIRHKGFIPWDDDVDVFMLRKEYEHFFDKYSKVGIGKYMLKGPKNGGETPFMKIIDPRTHAWSDNLTEKSHANDNLWIDIFPLDGLPQFFLVRCLFTLTIKFLMRIAGIHATKPRMDRTWLRRQNRKVWKFLLSWTTANGLSKVQDKLASICSVEKSKYVGVFDFAGFERKRWFRKYEFLQTVDVEFEGMRVKAPSNYDETLRQIYGDYMKLPPEDQRVAHYLHVEIED